MVSPWWQLGGSALALLRSFVAQSWPPAPGFAPEDLVPPGSQAGRVFIVTGANSGVGLQLAKALHLGGATIYFACRSAERAAKAIAEVTRQDTATPGLAKAVPEGSLHFLPLDLADLASVQAFAAAFAARESRLDLLFHVAGVGNVPRGTTTAQGIEAHLGTNCVGLLALTQALRPLLRATASRPDAPAGSVRVVWTASLSMETFTPRGGIDLAVLDGDDDDAALRAVHPWRAYGVSKCGNWFLARACARRLAGDGVVSAAVNPGQLRTDAWRHVSGLLMLLMRPTLYDAHMGALPMLYAGFAPEVAARRDGCYVMPWGRLMQRCAREDIEEALRDGADEHFWQWCDTKARVCLKKER